MPVTTRYLKVNVPQGMPRVRLDSNGCATCRILPDESSKRRQALGFAAAGFPARSNRLLIASVAAAIVLMVGAVSGCSHKDSTPAATATPAPNAAPNASPLAGIWRNDDLRDTSETFELRVTQVDQTVYLKTCRPDRCTATYTGQLAADTVANFTLENRTARIQIDASGHMLLLSGKPDPTSGSLKPDTTASFHKASSTEIASDTPTPTPTPVPVVAKILPILAA